LKLLKKVSCRGPTGRVNKRSTQDLKDRLDTIKKKRVKNNPTAPINVEFGWRQFDEKKKNFYHVICKRRWATKKAFTRETTLNDVLTVMKTV